MVQAQALVYRLALTKVGKPDAQVASPRGVTKSLVARLAVALKLPELKKCLNAL